MQSSNARSLTQLSSESGSDFFLRLAKLCRSDLKLCVVSKSRAVWIYPYQVQGTRTTSWTDQNSFSIVGHLYYKNLTRLVAFPCEPADKDLLIWSTMFPPLEWLHKGMPLNSPFSFNWWSHHIPIENPLYAQYSLLICSSPLHIWGPQ